MKTIKILPLEEVDTVSSPTKENRNLTQWVLTYIEFIGNVVILVYMVVFTSVYWFIGLVLFKDPEDKF